MNKHVVQSSKMKNFWNSCHPFIWMATKLWPTPAIIIYDLRAARDVYRAAPALCFILLHFSQRGSSHLDSTHVLVTLFWRFIYVHVFFSKSSLGIIFETWCESKCFIIIRWLKMKCSWFTLSFKRAIMINVPNYR